MCSDVQNKMFSYNSHIVTLVIGVPDTHECLSPETVRVCVSGLVKGCGCVRQRTRELERMESD